MNILNINFKLVAVLLAATFVFASCNEDDDDTMQNEQMSIVEIASDNDDFSSLVAALQKADLVSVLQGEGPFTVFAPTNDAFATLLADLGASSLDNISAEALTPILLTHVISKEVKSTALSNGYVATANNTGPNGTNISIKIDISNGVKINNSVDVTTADLDASNGVIHVVNAVILPTNVVDIASQNSDFTQLVGALSAADGDLVTTLSGDGPFTVFAPTNAAFDAISSVVAGLTTAELAGVLTYHVANGNVRSNELSNGQTVTTLNGTFTIDLSGSSPAITDGAGNTVNIIATDVQGTNGVVHVIDAVLLQ